MAYANREQVRTISTNLRLSPAVDAELHALAARMGTSKSALARDLTEIGMANLTRVLDELGDGLCEHYEVTPLELISRLLKHSLQALRDTAEQERLDRREQ